MDSRKRFADLYPNLIAAVKASGGDSVSICLVDDDDQHDEQGEHHRVAAHALALAIGIKLVDRNGPIPPAILATLPAVERQARAYIARVDPARQSYRRALRASPLIAWKLAQAAFVTAPWLFASLLFACIGWGPGATFAFLWSVAAALFGAIVAFLAAVLALLRDAGVWVYHHPGEAWMDVRWFCCALAIWIPIRTWMRWSEQAELRPAASPDRGYGPRAIGNFRETSPFGDAQLADRASIARALQGHAVGHAPTFKE